MSSDASSESKYSLSDAELKAAKTLTLRWALEIILVLDKGPTRYKELSEAIPISQGVLSKRLTDLLESGVIARDCLNPQDERKRYLYSIHPDRVVALRKVCRAVRAYAKAERVVSAEVEK